MCVVTNTLTCAARRESVVRVCKAKLFLIQVNFLFLYCSNKASAVNEEEYNTQNKSRHFSPETYRVHTSLNKEESRYQGIYICTYIIIIVISLKKDCSFEA